VAWRGCKSSWRAAHTNRVDIVVIGASTCGLPDHLRVIPLAVHGESRHDWALFEDVTQSVAAPPEPGPPPRGPMTVDDEELHGRNEELSPVDTDLAGPDPGAPDRRLA
jgi:hypothetical protein